MTPPARHLVAVSGWKRCYDSVAGQRFGPTLVTEVLGKRESSVTLVMTHDII